ncbi:putative transcription elongation factor SII [Mandarin fish ranavirus]|nr:putative transcription elongation factor SII [Mandarin fish ranavirus]
MTTFKDVWEQALDLEKGVCPGRRGFSHPCFDKLRQSELQNHQPPVLPSEGTVTCPVCKSKRVHAYQKQTRSADEPMTLFALCALCGKRWTA